MVRTLKGGFRIDFLIGSGSVVTGVKLKGKCLSVVLSVSSTGRTWCLSHVRIGTTKTTSGFGSWMMTMNSGHDDTVSE